MIINDDTIISVYNYNKSNIVIKSNIKTYILEPAKEVPTMVYIPFSEVKYINQNYKAVRTGLVKFDKEKEADIYNALGIENWEKILTNEEIEKIILKPTMEGLTKIVNIEDPVIFDRIETIYKCLKIVGNDIQNRVVKIMETRASEFDKGILKTKIEIKPLNAERDIYSETEKQLKEVEQKNVEMEKQIEELKKQLAESNKVKTETTTTTKSTATTKSTKK